jgi:two-component system nitrogen regulation response regulator GlnG
LAKPFKWCELVAKSPAMGGVVKTLQKATVADGPLLIEGEAGTGKEFAARYVHYSGFRRNRPFSTLQITAVPPELIEKELYHTATGKLRQARGGSLLLKELWALPHSAQKRLADILLAVNNTTAGREQTPLEINAVRLMMTSSMGLDEAVACDFVVPELATLLDRRRVVLPPLRRRPSDIKVLADHFFAEIATDLECSGFEVSQRVVEQMEAYGWPGNVAELKNVVRQLVTRSVDGKVEEEHLTGLVATVDQEVPLDKFSLEELVRAKLKTFLQRIQGYRVEGLYTEVMSRVERPLLELVIRETGGNQVQAASILGINRNTLRKKLRGLGIRRR